MDIIQQFYNNLAGQYDRLFRDWDASVSEQAAILDRLFSGICGLSGKYHDNQENITGIGGQYGMNLDMHTISGNGSIIM